MPDNLRYRRRVLEAGYGSESAARELWVACRRDILFWVNTFVWTFNPRMMPKITTRPMVTYGFQDQHIWDLLSAIINQCDHQTEKSREMTATWNILIVFLWLSQFHGEPDGYSFRVISRNADLVDSPEDPDALFSKMDFVLEHQPPWILDESQYNRKGMHLRFYETNTTIDGNSTTNDAARGGRATAMALDEFAAAPNGYAMLSATRDTTSCRLYNSTPKGTGNAFYDLKKRNIRRTRLHWSAHPDKRRGLYRSENGKLVLLDKTFRGIVRDAKGNGTIFPDKYIFRLDGKLRSPWYDKECDRSVHPMEIAQELDIDYLGSDYQFFVPNIIERISKEDVREPLHTGEIDFDIENARPIGFTPTPEGRLQLWFNPMDESQFPYNIEVIQGADVAAGTGASNSALSFVNKQTGEKIAEFADPNIKAEDFAIYAVAMAKWFNKAFMIWDASGPHGRIFGNTVLELQYPNVYYKTNIHKISRLPSDMPGFFLNPGDKAIAFAKYRRALKERTFIQRSHEANRECLFFIQVVGAQAIEHSNATNTHDPTGARANHGDRCTADVMANFGLVYFREMKSEEKETTVPDSSFRARRDAYESKLAEQQEVWT